MQEFWVNNQDGAPYFFVTGRVNEKLQEAIMGQIIPKLLTEIPCKYSEQELTSDPELPRFTIVFDREAYSLVFFQKLCKDNRVAVLTYRKNVKDKYERDEVNPSIEAIMGIAEVLDTTIHASHANAGCAWTRSLLTRAWPHPAGCALVPASPLIKTLRPQYYHTL